MTEEQLLAESHSVASEFAVWATEIGWTPAETLKRLGVTWHGRGLPDLDDAKRLVAIEWRRLVQHSPWIHTPQIAA